MNQQSLPKAAAMLQEKKHKRENNRRKENGRNRNYRYVNYFCGGIILIMVLVIVLIFISQKAGGKDFRPFLR